jgi:hypothetical protein
VTFGRILPETASAKSSAAAPSLGQVFAYLMQAIKLLAATHGLLWVGVLVLIGLVWLRNSRSTATDRWQVREEESVPASISPGVGPWTVWGPVAFVGIAAVWTTALLGGYALRQVWIISRYVCPLSPVLLLAMALVAEWLMRGTAIDRTTLGIGRRIIQVSVVLSLLANGWLFTTQVLPHARQFPAGVRECYLDLGFWLRDNTPDDAVIAALDIGALGYGSERRILDLMGLVSPEILALGQQLGFGEMVTSGAWLQLGADHKPDYFVDRAEGEPRWSGRTVHGVRFELLQTCVMPGLGLRENQPWTVALYRLVSTETRVKSSAGG